MTAQQSVFLIPVLSRRGKPTTLNLVAIRRVEARAEEYRRNAERDEWLLYMSVST
jgi:hypothetical protein